MNGIVIVTGAAGALGRGVSKRLANDDWKVVAVDRCAAGALPSLASQRLAEVDLTDEAATEHAFAEIIAPDGIAGLVNVAGGFSWEKVAGGSKTTWDRLYAMNVATALNASKAAIPMLRRGSAIVNVAAAAAVKAESGMGAYAASKSGVARLTEALAAELKSEGVRVNAVLPSIIDTPINRSDMPDADFAKWVTVDELSEVIAFLLSERASGITGALLPVTGRV